MAVIGDMRKSEFRDRKFVYGRIINYGFLPETRLILYAERPEESEGRVEKMHKETVKRLRQFNACKRGLIFMTLYHDRPRAV